jgi:hypothetical protein
MVSTQKTKDVSKHYSIVYIGEDKNYFDVIKGRFAKGYSELHFDYHSFLKVSIPTYQKVFIEILKLKPNVIYIDFSARLDVMLKLAHLIGRENALKKVPIIGLVEGQKNLVDCKSTGADFVHIKSGEIHDMIYDAAYMAFPDKTKHPKFAKAKTEKIISLIDDFRLGYISPEHIHVETNFQLEVGSTVKIESAIPKNLVPSKFFIVKESYTTNLYYDFTYAYDLEFVYVDMPVITSLEERLMGIEDQDKIKKIHEQFEKDQRHNFVIHAAKVNKTKQALKNWVEEQSHISLPKKTKILIVDPTLEVYKGEHDSFDKYPFTLRTQTFLTEPLYEIDKLRPDIMTFRYDVDERYELELAYQKSCVAEGTDIDEQAIYLEKKNEFDHFMTRVVERIKSLNDYSPFIILFNAKRLSSSELQKQFNYQQMLADAAASKAETVVKLAQMYEKKRDDAHKKELQEKLKKLKESDPAKYRKTTISDLEGPRFYINKTHPLSHVYNSFEVMLTTMTESELTFKTKARLPLASYRLDFLGPMGVTLIPTKDGNDAEDLGEGYFLYHGLIHSTGEERKKDIRKFVYEVFLTPVREKQEQEKQAFDSLNQQKEEERRKKELEQKRLKAQEMAQILKVGEES